MAKFLLDANLSPRVARDAPRRDIGIIHLDLPTRLRTIPAITSVLGDFFARYAETINLEHSLVIFREDHLEIHPA